MMAIKVVAPSLHIDGRSCNITVNQNGHLFMPDLNALDRFALVVETGSFSAAARRLAVSRQAIHRSIETLEREHGVQLIERSTRKLRLTDAGRRLSRVAQTIRDAGRDADAVLRAARDAPRGLLRISAPPLFADAVLSKVLPEFLTRFADVEIEAHFESRRMDRHRDDLDLSIRIGAPPPEQTYAVRLGQAAMVLCTSPSYLQAHPAPTHPDQLLAHELLAYGRGHRRWSFRGPEGDVSIDVHPRAQTDSASVMVQICLAGLGILRVPRLAVAAQLRAGTLCEVLPAWSIPAAETWAIYGHRAASDPTLAALLEALRAIDWEAVE